MRNVGTRVLALFVSLGAIGVSHAGPYADDLGKCLVQSTTISDKGTLVKWVFAMASLHPEVKTASSFTSEQRTEITRSTANLFTDLITERCKEKALDAIKYEGPSTLQASFEVLGQAAMMELFANPDVARGLAELATYFDKNKFEAAFGPPKTH